MDELAAHIRSWAQELGFQQVGFSDIELGEYEVHLNDWLSRGFHGEMDYMQRHGTLRSRPAAAASRSSRAVRTPSARAISCERAAPSPR